MNKLQKLINKTKDFKFKGTDTDFLYWNYNLNKMYVEVILGDFEKINKDVYTSVLYVYKDEDLCYQDTIHSNKQGTTLKELLKALKGLTLKELKQMEAI